MLQLPTLQKGNEQERHGLSPSAHKVPPKQKEEDYVLFFFGKIFCVISSANLRIFEQLGSSGRHYLQVSVINGTFFSFPLTPGASFIFMPFATFLSLPMLLLHLFPETCGSFYSFQVGVCLSFQGAED